MPCGWGKWSAATRATTDTVCQACPLGTASNQRVAVSAATCSDCPQGSFAGSTGSSTCALCAEGSFQPNTGQDQCTQCSQGTHAKDEGMTECQACEPGYFSNQPGQEHCQECPAGRFAAASNAVACDLCDAGRFSQLASSGCEDCASGSIAPNRGTASCQVCLPGTIAESATAATCRLCSEGRYAGGYGWTQCEKCSPGFSQNMTGQRECSPCMPGRFAGAEEARDCQDCQAGKAQPLLGSSSCDDCEGGHVAPSSGLPECTPCDEGYYSASTQQCRQCATGRHAPNVGTAQCLDCPEGSVAPSQGQSACSTCPLGTAPDAADLNCVVCPRGKFAGSPGSPTCEVCPSGRYGSIQQASSCSACPQGRFSELNGSSSLQDCELCPNGRYNALVAQAECQRCPGGTALQGQGAVSVDRCQDCARGAYSDPGSGECLPCPPGNYSGGGAAECSDCEAGTYAAAEGTTECHMCRPGTYREAQESAMSCTDCPLGRFSPSLKASSIDTCILCPAGTHGSVPGQSDESLACSDCTAGKSSEAGLESCSSCPAGRHSGPRAATCEVCEAGRYVDTPDASSCDPCQRGRFREAGSAVSTSCEMCPEGTYQPMPAATKSDDCLMCPAGTFQPFVSAENQLWCLPCPPGAYSGDGFKGCEKCPAGRVSGESSAICSTCAAGRYQNETGQSDCKWCQAGRYREDGDPNSTACQPCPVGSYGRKVGATTRSSCLACLPGRFSATEGQPRCEICAENTYGDESGMSSCKLCSPASSTPAGALSCCPIHDAVSWPVSPAGSLYTLPGKSNAEVFRLDSCSGAVRSTAEAVQTTPSRPTVAAGDTHQISLATVTAGSVHECVSWTCGDSVGKCVVSVRSESDRFLPGEGFSVVAFVRSVGAAAAFNGSNATVANNYSMDGFVVEDEVRMAICPAEATLLLAGFGCEPATLMFFLIALSSVVCLTVVIGLCLEAAERSRLVVYVESAMDISLPPSGPGKEHRFAAGPELPMPTEREIREVIARGLGLPLDAVPQEKLTTWYHDARSRRSVHVEFAVRTNKGEHQEMKRKLMRLTWAPGEGGPWEKAKIVVQPPGLVKAAGSAAGMDLVVMLERAALIFLGGIEDEDHEQRECHKEAARELLTRLLTPRARYLLLMQYAMNLAVAGVLPGLAYNMMAKCSDGYPNLLHSIWLLYIGASSLVSVCLVSYLGGPAGRRFVRMFRSRLVLRVVFMGVMLTDTYQDATFPVIAKVCGFDLWFVSAWLVVLGVGLMQVCAQVFVTSKCYVQYHRARTPEERERLLVQGAFLALRGSDNLVLVYAVRPAVEERLGGASSWAMKTSEARIAFFRFLFEDVEQSALQVVFLVFYEDAATSDKVWVTLSIATSLLLSFTLVVQVLPEVRDWLWYRVLVQLPGSRTFSALRMPWLLLCLVIYRAVSAFPWISACSPSGDPCTQDDPLPQWWRTNCNDGKSELLGFPSRYEVVSEVSFASGFCVLVLSATILAAAATWVVQKSRLRRHRQWKEEEDYSAARRFAAAEKAIRPKRGEDTDRWLRSAQELRKLAIAATSDPRTDASRASATEAERPLPRLVEVIDGAAFDMTRARGKGRSWFLDSRSNKELGGYIEELRQHRALKALGPEAVREAGVLARELWAVQRIAEVRQNAKKLLSDKSFIKASLVEKAEAINNSTHQAAPLQFVHWSTIEAMGCLPECGSPAGAEPVGDLLHRLAEKLELTKEKAARRIVPFFLSHRWLRTRGPRAGHHPDSEDNIKAKCLVDFAKWFSRLAAEKGLHCEVVYWIDYCCCDQRNPLMTEIGIAALPLYISACMKVIAWATPDFDRRCWTMVERLLSYSFCIGGLTPYAIDETFVADPLEKDLGLDDHAGDGGPPSPSSLLLSARVATSGSDGPAAAMASDSPAEEVGAKEPGKVETDVKPRRSYKRRLSYAGYVEDLSNEVQRRAKKLPNPLDFETCQVTQLSDRRLVAQLVDIALAVPAQEVFADRQSVEFGLTEVIEQSLVMGQPLPGKTIADKESGEWLQLQECPRMEWRLIVEAADDRRGPLMHHDADAIVWVDHDPLNVPEGSPQPSPEKIEDLFAKADEAIELSADPDGAFLSPNDAIRALVEALKMDLDFAMNAPGMHGEELEAAVLRTKEVELPMKQAAIERICTNRLQAALASGSELEMRNALRGARASGATHLEIYRRVHAEQQRLYKQALLVKLDAQMQVATSDGDIDLLIMIFKVASSQNLDDMMIRCNEVGKAIVRKSYLNGNLLELTHIQRSTLEAKWLEMASVAKTAHEDATMLKALERAAATDNLSAMRAVEKHAGSQGRKEIKERASMLVQECASRVKDKMGLPAEWDVVLELAGPTARPDGLLKKTEDARLVEVVQKLLNETYTGWGGLGKGTRTRDRAGESAAWLEVKSVVYVQNAENFVNFRARRAALAAECPAGMKTTGWNVRTKGFSLAGVGRFKDNPVDTNLNEYYLFHGTSPEAAIGITDRDFDIKKAGSAFGALFGGGIYFAESSMKSDEYVKADSRGWYPMLLCRVVCGNMYYCDAVDPTKHRAELEGACKPGGPGFHSVLGDREKVRRTFREFIVYDSHQVYPEFIVWYARRT
eukprot:TRINITY_DN32675_c0_g1_i6.p1 TRINITY_DN32675_c0_g1~~TRINITY_DN32675_c0_g1_i6.p1  ORF type:complete len:2595 (+),score=526.95 TRINITY_DN32675_c0_g1_i6:959-8743(+)